MLDGPVKRKIRLMQITHDLAIGGLQRVVVDICKFIDREQFEVEVLCLRSLGRLTVELEKMGVLIHLLPQKKEGTNYFSFLNVASLLRKRKIDVIHTHNTQPFIDGTLGALLANVKSIVHTDHSREYPDKKRYMLAERFVSKFAYRVAGVSEATSRDLIKYIKISPGKIVTVLNGIDSSLCNIDVNKKRKKEELGINRQGPIIGLGVRLTQSKGIQYLLQAMPRIIDSYPKITLVVAGEGDYEDYLRKYAEILGVAKNTLFVGPRSDMHEIVKIFDLYVLPSLREGLPIALLEAMAIGCPVIATRVGGIPTAIKNNENGILVEPMNPIALANAILMLLGDANLRAQYVTKGRELFAKKFNAIVMVGKYEMLYKRAIKGINETHDHS